MWSISRHRDTAAPGDNPLVAVVQPFDHELRRALYAATNSVSLRRRTWNGCALNRAATILGRDVNHLSAAADAFHLSPQRIHDFITTWDRLRGSDGHCTELLRDALLAVGLFPAEDARASDQVATSS